METENELKNLENLINGYFDNSDYNVIELIFRGEKGTKVLEIFVDNVKGINIDEITRINKDISGLIDSREELGNISNLIVSSPGTERPVKFLWQLFKHKGRTLEVEMNDGEKFEGKLEGISENELRITLEINVKEKGKKTNFITREVNFKDIKELKVKLSFSKK